MKVSLGYFFYNNQKTKVHLILKGKPLCFSTVEKGSTIVNVAGSCDDITCQLCKKLLTLYKDKISVS